jgi:hypothetical protein
MGILGHFPRGVRLAFRVKHLKCLNSKNPQNPYPVRVSHVYFVVFLVFFDLFLLVIAWFLLGFLLLLNRFHYLGTP